MKTYELTYIITPEISLEEAGVLAKEIEAVLQSGGGVILRQEKLSAKTLAYPVKKHASGFVGSIEFQAEQEMLANFRQKLEKEEKIMRHIIIIKEAPKTKKVRRQRAAASTVEIKTEMEPKLGYIASHDDAGNEKVELKDIEQKLDEILGQ